MQDGKRVKDIERRIAIHIRRTDYAAWRKGTNMLSVEQIENVLKLDTTLEEKGRKLIVKSNNRGGTDNISVVMLECGGE